MPSVEYMWQLVLVINFFSVFIENSMPFTERKQTQKPFFFISQIESRDNDFQVDDRISLVRDKELNIPHIWAEESITLSLTSYAESFVKKLFIKSYSAWVKRNWFKPRWWKPSNSKLDRKNWLVRFCHMYDLTILLEQWTFTLAILKTQWNGTYKYCSRNGINTSRVVIRLE